MLERERLGPRDIDHPIENHMRHMDALRTKLARQRLRQCSQRELARCEGREQRRPLYTSCCAGEDEGWWVWGLLSSVKKEGEGALGEGECSFSVSTVRSKQGI